MNRMLAIPGLAIILAGPVAAQEESQPAVPLEQADSVLELLELVRLEASEGSRLNRERVERFRQARDERQRMLEEVSRQLAAEERRSNTLNRRYEQNESDLADLEERLQIRVGNFGELFGVVRDVAGDTVGQILTSLVSAQYPDRVDLVRDMAEAKELPSLEDLRGRADADVAGGNGGIRPGRSFRRGNHRPLRPDERGQRDPRRRLQPGPRRKVPDP